MVLDQYPQVYQWIVWRFVHKFEKWMINNQVDHAEDIFLGKTLILLAVEPSCSLACYSDGWTDGQTDWWTDEQGETSIPPFNFIEAGV